MKKRLTKLSGIALILLALMTLDSCHWFRKLTYNVKDNEHMLVSNDLVTNGDETIEADIVSVIRQQPNMGTTKLRLRAYNAVNQKYVDRRSAKIRAHWVKKRIRQDKNDLETNTRRQIKAVKKFNKNLEKYKKENKKRLKKAKKINERKEQRLKDKNERLVKRQTRVKDKRGHTILKKKRQHVFIPYKPELIDTVLPTYKKKERVIFKLKDTLNVRISLPEKLKYNFGEAPVIADTSQLTKTVEQMNAFLKAKGYYSGKVEGSFKTTRTKGNKEKAMKPKQIRAEYRITTGERTYIDSVFIFSSNPTVTNVFVNKFLKKKEDKNGYNPLFYEALVNKKPLLIPYDAFALSNYRAEIAAVMTEEKLYGFTEQNITYRVDTAFSRNSGSHRMKLTIRFTDRLVQTEDGATLTVPFREALVSKVNFHISDTTYMDAYSETLKQLNYDVKEELKKNYKEIPTVNSYIYKERLEKIKARNANGEILQCSNKSLLGKPKDSVLVSLVNKNVFGKPKDSIGIDKKRIATFYYNGELFVNPGLIECQNYLEATNYYKEYYIERSYTRMQQLGLFSQVDMRVTETVPGSGILNVDYYLVPSTRQSFTIQPKGTYVNGFFGVSGSLSYSTLNLARTGTKMSFSLESGFDQNSTIVKRAEDDPFFNTIEVAPTLKFDIPGLFPYAKVTSAGKRQRPRTEIIVSYNYQQRVDFKRNLLQFGWMYNVSPGTGKNAIIGFGFPLAAIKFVSIDKKPEFEARINELNDLFLKNAYSNQLIWEDARFNWNYSNEQDENLQIKNLVFTVSTTLAHVGGFAQLLTSKKSVANDQGQHSILGVPYSQFGIGDAKLIANYKLKNKKSLAFRFMYGVGLPYNNSPTSLPYDYSFSSGGANDVRGWQARQIGPGTYLSLLDSNAVKTQIGDIRLQSSLEFRFGKGIFKQAFFIDAGNTWTMRYDSLRPGSQISNQSYKQLAIGAGYGLRLDFDFFIFRIDLGIPIHNPTLPDGSRWIFEKPKSYNDLATTIYGENYKKVLEPYQLRPFRPQLHIGIGFPF